MSDHRLTSDPAQVDRAEPGQLATPVADLLRAPDGRRERQLLLGDPLTVLGTRNSWSYIRSDKDGYHGWLPAEVISARTEPTHIVTALATHAYTAPDIKAPDMATLSFGSRVRALEATESFTKTSHGHIPTQHLSPLPWHATDPAAIAERFTGTPYLWGGNSRLGLDCSGLVQTALMAAGLQCPADSDLQQSTLPPIEQANRRADLIFWKGHVAMLLDTKTLIHANAHHMAVTIEPIETAVSRIAKKEYGAITGFARPSFGRKYAGGV